MTLEELKQKFFKRQFAYKTVFDTKSQHVQLILKDLARFCRADKTTFHENDRAHVLAEGRREVWLRIVKYKEMTTEQIIKELGVQDE